MLPVRLVAATLAVGVATGSGAATAGMFDGMFDAPLLAMLRDCDESVRPRSEAFGAGLLAEVSEDGTRNALVSPLGIGFVLEMVVPGAKSTVRRSIQEMLDTGDGSPERAGDGTDGTSSPGGDTSVAGPGDAEPADRPDAGGSSTGDPDVGESAAGGSHGDGPDGIEGSVWMTICRHVWVLHDASDDEAVRVRIANGAFADRRLDLFPAFSETLRRGFGARVERLDFTDERSVDRINAWVEEATGGAIPRLVSRLDPDDVLVLANAMRFEGGWAQPFDLERTVPAPFHLRSGTAPKVPTMHADALPARYREGEDFQAVALPYGGGRFEFVAVLPRAGLDAPDALRRLAADPSWLGGRGFRKARGALALPRLALEAEASLLPALRALGLGAALDDPRAFAGIAAPAPKLDRVLHRTMLVLDERGTVAAAATAAIMKGVSVIVEEERFRMRVDRPFALAVRHRGTGAVLFTAWVDDPTAGER